MVTTPYYTIQREGHVLQEQLSVTDPDLRAVTSVCGVERIYRRSGSMPTSAETYAEADTKRTFASTGRCSCRVVGGRSWPSATTTVQGYRCRPLLSSQTSTVRWIRSRLLR